MNDRKIGGFSYAQTTQKVLDYDKLEEYYNEHCQIVKNFAFLNPVSSYGIEREDYIQLLSIKLWELVKKFDWERYENKDYSELCKAFYTYVKTSFQRYRGELIRESMYDIKTVSLDANIDYEENNISLLDLISDEEKGLDEQYCLTKLREMKATSLIKGYLLDRIEGMTYSQIAKKYKCSRGKVSRQIEKELEILKKVV